MPLSRNVWDSAVKRARSALVMLARQRLPQRLWHKVGPSDVVQNTLKEAHEKRWQFKGTSKEQLLAWLRPMLLHRLIDEIRRYKAKKQDARLEVPLLKLFDQASAQLRTELVAVGASPSQSLMRREAIDRVGKALEGLPEDQRLVVELHFLQGLKSGEIASVLGQPVSTIPGLLHRGLKNLREALKGVI